MCCIIINAQVHLGLWEKGMPIFELFLILCDTQNIVLGVVLMYFVDKKLMLFVSWRKGKEQNQGGKKEERAFYPFPCPWT